MHLPARCTQSCHCWPTSLFVPFWLLSKNEGGNQSIKILCCCYCRNISIYKLCNFLLHKPFFFIEQFMVWKNSNTSDYVKASSVQQIMKSTRTDQWRGCTTGVLILWYHVHARTYPLSPKVKGPEYQFTSTRWRGLEYHNICCKHLST